MNNIKHLLGYCKDDGDNYQEDVIQMSFNKRKEEEEELLYSVVFHCNALTEQSS